MSKIDIDIRRDYVLEKQGFINLIKNGNFASWSAGDNGAPDGWNFDYSVIQRITTSIDNTLGHDFARLTTDASGAWVGLWQNESNNELINTIYQIAKQQKLTVTARAKIRSSSDKVLLRIWAGTTFNHAYHSGSGEWEDLQVSYTFNGSENQLFVGATVEGENNTTNITFDVGEVSFYIGNLALPYQENPLDRALEAVHYQGFETNYGYRGLRVETGYVYAQGVSASGTLVKTITFQKPFKKILSISTGLGDNTYFCELRVDPLTLTNSTFDLLYKNNDPMYHHYPHVFWIAIGVD